MVRILPNSIIGIVPAAGIARRMRPFTNVIPKQLLFYGNKPIIHHILEMFIENDIRDVIIVVKNPDSLIRKYVGHGVTFGLRVQYAFQEAPFGVGHALLCAKHLIEKSSDIKMIVQVNGDRLVRPPQILTKLVQEHLKMNALTTFLAKRVIDPSGYGVFRVKADSMQILEIVEKPLESQRKRLQLPDGNYLASAGIYVHSPKIFTYLEETEFSPKTGELQLTEAIKKAISKRLSVIATDLECETMDFGTPHRYLMAQWKLYQSLRDDDIKRMTEEWIRLRDL